ncbi:hypothetical protein Y032_0007g3229 [Ancylostoma ceylanicum]|nr:hypothetical protein Y032_0007g3229 [Ancylostoma ceylanicum]
MSFGVTFEGDLISVIEGEHSIWDPSFGEVKIAWKGLRDHWRRLNNKKTGSSAEGPWVFSKSLRFLEFGEVTGNKICNFDETCASQDILEDEENSPPLDSPSPEENSIFPARGILASTTPLSKRKRHGSPEIAQGAPTLPGLSNKVMSLCCLNGERLRPSFTTRRTVLRPTTDAIYPIDR